MAVTVGFLFQLLNRCAGKVEDSLPERLVGGERHGGAAGGDGEDGGGIEDRVASEVRRARNLLLGAGAGGLGDCGEGVEEVPEGGSVGDGVVDGDSDEDAVGELGDLDGDEGEVVAGV